jgi:ABC-type nitrate/sulfonate/bicarbonate transport system substrate-binding protein
MKNLNKIFFFLLLSVLAITRLSFAGSAAESDLLTEDFKNVILMGWDGTQRDTIIELLQEGKLPNLEEIIQAGTFVKTEITTGKTETKPGWAEILTGYSGRYTGVVNNRDEYKPIPKGYTIFERLENAFKNTGIETIFLSGKGVNLGVRGEHRVWPLGPRHIWAKEELWSKSKLHPQPGEILTMEGEPYALTKDSIDIFENGLGNSDAVGKKAVAYIKKFQKMRFFLFVHFEEPDEQGHKYGGGSKEYVSAILKNDLWLGKIISTLKRCGIYTQTLIYITTDHGFEKNGKHHRYEPLTFLATNDTRVNSKTGDRKDITPTILYGYGFDITKISPPLEGKPLINSFRTKPEYMDVAAEASQQSTDQGISAQQPIRIGYFYGGRTVLLMRAYADNWFEKDSLAVEYYSKNLHKKEFHLVPKSIEEFNEYGGEGSYSGKVTGIELIDGIMEDKFDMAMVGESSFIDAICSGKPIVAIAELGHDVKGHPDHVFLMRKGLKVGKPQDYFGKLMISRRAGPGDSVFLREFLYKQGIDVDRDTLQLDNLPLTLKEKENLPKDKVIIVDYVPEDMMKQGIENYVIDGGYFHLGDFIKQHNKFNLIQTLDYLANPEISHALLVCRKDFLSNNRVRCIKFLETYIKRIRYEHSLSYTERTRKQTRGLRIAVNFFGLNYPQHDLIPTINVELLYQMMNLLKKYKIIGDNNVKIENYVDNSLVLEAAEDLGISEENDYWRPSEY